MSPDLTRNDKSKQGPSGGPITKDNTAVEYYDTIFTIDESPVKAGVIWVGSDDGLIHVTTDDGKNWQNVTPKDMPEWIRINCIAASPFDRGHSLRCGHHVSLRRLPSLPLQDHGLRKDAGRRSSMAFPADDFTRTIRPDPNQKGLLFAGTESHLYISYDDGDKWLPFQLNLPAVPVTDIAFQKRRTTWCSPPRAAASMCSTTCRWCARSIRQTSSARTRCKLFPVKRAIRISGGGGFGGGAQSCRRAESRERRDDLLLPQREAEGRSEAALPHRVRQAGARNFQQARRSEEKTDPMTKIGAAQQLAPAKEGLNRYVWDLRYDKATGFPGLLMWDGSLRRPRGHSRRITRSSWSSTAKPSRRTSRWSRIRALPPLRSTSRRAGLGLKIRDRVSEANSSVVRIRAANDQLKPYLTSSTRR